MFSANVWGFSSSTPLAKSPLAFKLFLPIYPYNPSHFLDYDTSLRKLYRIDLFHVESWLEWIDHLSLEYLKISNSAGFSPKLFLRSLEFGDRCPDRLGTNLSMWGFDLPRPTHYLFFCKVGSVLLFPICSVWRDQR